jgi:hypothetical protein
LILLYFTRIGGNLRLRLRLFKERTAIFPRGTEDFLRSNPRRGRIRLREVPFSPVGRGKHDDRITLRQAKSELSHLFAFFGLGKVGFLVDGLRENPFTVVDSGDFTDCHVFELAKGFDHRMKAIIAFTK